MLDDKINLQGIMIYGPAISDAVPLVEGMLYLLDIYRSIQVHVYMVQV